MQTFESSLTFTCPVCEGIFEFDRVEEHQLVCCPICGFKYITVRINKNLTLQHFELEERCK